MMPRLGDLEHSGQSFGAPLQFNEQYSDSHMLAIVRKHFANGYTCTGWSSRALEFEAMGAAVFHLCGVWLDADGLG